MLARWITPADGTLWRAATYRFHALVAAEWQRGRVFLAGDAAHQQPPFIGQGTCQGLRDVANLSWRIAHVLAGRAGPGLFESYGAERGAHVRRLTGRIKAIGQVICERDKVRAAARDARILAEGVLARWFDRHDCRAALVRPDHYVFGVAGADGVPALVRRLSCRLEAMSPVRTQAVA